MSSRWEEARGLALAMSLVRLRHHRTFIRLADETALEADTFLGPEGACSKCNHLWGEHVRIGACSRCLCDGWLP